MIRKCVICGATFKCSPSDKIITCSNKCRRERCRRANTAKSRPWSEDAKARLAAKGQTANLKKGTPAAQESPIAGPYETNQNALIWTLISPEGVIYEVRNLALWLRQNADILPGTPEQAKAGIMQIKRSMEGKTKRQVSQWKGWKLLDWRKPE